MVGRRAATVAVDDEPVAKIARTTNKVKFQLPIPKRPTKTGTTLGCGSNEVAQLGFDEDVAEKTRPAVIAAAVNAVAISAGGMHSLYLNDVGDVYSFGCNDEGALGRDTSKDGSEYEVAAVELPGKAVRISTGDSHSAALLEDGRVFGWGSFRDSHGSMGLTLEGGKRQPIELVPNRIFVDIVSGADHLVMLTMDGKVYTVGCGEQGQLGRVSARSSGGESRRGKAQLLMPGQVMFKKGKVDAIYASNYCTFVREHLSSQIYGFGLNNYYQLGLKKHLDLSFTPLLTTLENIKSITGGQHHTLVLTNDNHCQVLGRKDYGRLGIGIVEEDAKTLTTIPMLKDKRVEQISCGDCSSFAVTDEGTVYAWGMGSNNQLGLGAEEDAFEPVLLTGAQVKDKHVSMVNGGGQHTLFLVSGEKLAPAKVPSKTAAAAKETKTKANGIAAATDKSKNVTESKKMTNGVGGETGKNKEIGSGDAAAAAAAVVVPTEKKKDTKKK